jgi:hypothetical protein
MNRIDTINARENMFGVGKSGFHDNADLPGQDATYVSPKWFNTVQEELCNLLELRGITLDPASKRQLYDLLTTQADLEALADEIETNFIRKSQIVDNLTTNDANKVASARTVKELNDSKLSKLDFDDAYKYMPIPYPKLIPPSGFLVMMGQDIVESIHPKLFALYGSKLPDMRAYMIRGLDNGRGIDVNRVILSEQGDAIREIYGDVLGGLVNNTGQESKHTGAFQYKTRSESKTVGAGWGENHSSIASFKASNIVPTASENRVKNIAFLYIVKAG